MLTATALVVVAPEPTQAPADHPRVEALVFDVEGLSQSELDQAVELRLPGRPRMPAGDPGARAQFELYGYVQIRRARKSWTLALILSDGRALYRTLSPSDSGAGSAALVPRLAASQLANLIGGIEEGRVAPDAEDVPVPDQVEPAKPDDTPLPVAERTAPPPKPAPADRGPRFEVGPHLWGGVALGLASPSPSGMAGGGGGVGLLVRHRGGGLFGIDARFLGSTAEGVALVRSRVSLIGGYGFRKKHFSLITTAGLSAEPWFVRESGSRESLVESDGRSRRTAWMLGGLVSITPGFVYPVGRRGAAVRLGPRFEVSGSALSNGGGVARIRDGADTRPDAASLRIGGLELGLGLEFGMWFGA